ncbi:GspE/PulE family protein [uncultured Paraglaciecola sp.]|uniref:GspE/PulE family protein n=1 Tax=uncultured Paraglaciecola sp. TaxID=1765024 RepID=UPI0025FC7E72|nr:type II/IV secretion system protein [uncultured Paraglaciecola sp.]
MNLNDILKNEYRVSSQDIEQAEKYQSRIGGRIEQILVNLGSLPTEQLPNLYSTFFSIPMVKVSDWLDSELPELTTQSKNILLNNRWVPLQVSGTKWVFACAYPLEPEVNQWLSQEEIEFELFIAMDSDIQILSQRFSSQSVDNFNTFDSDDEDRLIELATETPTVNLLNSLIIRALRQGASDMHLEPYEGSYRARFRVDGVLHEAERISPKMQLPIVTRLKILSGMDIAEKRRPQDGKIEMKIASEELDIRVSALPLNDGESMVMRFLRKESIRYDMAVLGLSDDIENLIKEDLTSTAGVILLTGPTGSGKTTTLYTFLNELNDEDVKIVTLEDPVEYQLEGINQVQVNSDIGFDFSAGLRSIVRQDPDIIMLGEIRDSETAKIAMQSALTGHLVFSTVHTNDAPSAYTRLLDLGVEEFLLNAALVSIVAQRLARKICEHCAVPEENLEGHIEKYQLKSLAKRFAIEKINLQKGKGCELCAQTGYKGRMAVTEYLRCDDHIKSLPKGADFTSAAKLHNKELNRRTLMEDGLYKAMLGLTTIEEVVRVAG